MARAQRRTCVHVGSAAAAEIIFSYLFCDMDRRASVSRLA